jgi:hypothetical protein
MNDEDSIGQVDPDMADALRLFRLNHTKLGGETADVLVPEPPSASERTKSPKFKRTETANLYRSSSSDANSDGLNRGGGGGNEDIAAVERRLNKRLDGLAGQLEQLLSQQTLDRLVAE